MLVDHGVTVTERHDPAEDRIRYSRIGYRFRLSEVPLTFGFGRSFVSGGPVASLYRVDPRTAEPHVAVVDGDGKGFGWFPEPDLLGSDAFSRAFVAEPDNLRCGIVALRGRDVRAPALVPGDRGGSRVVRLLAIYRVGNGRAGQRGRRDHRARHRTRAHRGRLADHRRGAQPAAGLRRRRPRGDRAGQARGPGRLPCRDLSGGHRGRLRPGGRAAAQVSRAAATFRWTGSWYTVFVDRRPSGHRPGRRPPGASACGPSSPATGRPATTWRSTRRGSCPWRSRSRCAPNPTTSPATCGGRSPTRARQPVLPDGRVGFFHPDNFTFSQPVHLSRLYAAVAAVEGVDSAEVVTFKRYGEAPAGELARRRIDSAASRSPASTTTPTPRERRAHPDHAGRK